MNFFCKWSVPYLKVCSTLFHSQFNSLFLVNIILDGYGSVNSLMNYTRDKKNLLWFEDYIRLPVHNLFEKIDTMWYATICPSDNYYRIIKSILICGFFYTIQNWKNRTAKLYSLKWIFVVPVRVPFLFILINNYLSCFPIPIIIVYLHIKKIQ